MRNCCALLLTKTWINNNITESSYHIDRLLPLQVDQSHVSGKMHGGLCVYINKDWRINWSETLKCRPHYLPQEFTVMFIMAFYIPPSANISTALSDLHDHISALQNKHPGSFLIMLN